MPHKPTLVLPDGLPDDHISGKRKSRKKGAGTPRTHFATPEMKKKRANAIEAKYKLDIVEVCKVIVRERGMLNEVALAFGVTRNVISAYIGNRSLCAETLKQAREAMGDVAEGKLYELIEAGDFRSIAFYLSTVHKARGYGVKRRDETDGLESSMHISTINIVSIPSGQFLPPDGKSGPMIEHQAELPFRSEPEPVIDDEPVANELASCLT